MIADKRITYNEAAELYNTIYNKLINKGILESTHQVPEEMTRPVFRNKIKACSPSKPLIYAISPPQLVGT